MFGIVTSRRFIHHSPYGTFGNKNRSDDRPTAARSSPRGQPVFWDTNKCDHIPVAKRMAQWHNSGLDIVPRCSMYSPMCYLFLSHWWLYKVLHVPSLTSLRCSKSYKEATIILSCRLSAGGFFVRRTDRKEQIPQKYDPRPV